VRNTLDGMLDNMPLDIRVGTVVVPLLSRVGVVVEGQEAVDLEVTMVGVEQEEGELGDRTSLCIV